MGFLFIFLSLILLSADLPLGSLAISLFLAPLPLGVALTALFRFVPDSSDSAS